MKQTVLAMLIVTALAGGGGAFYGLRVASLGPQPRAEADAHPADATAATSLPANSSLFDLTPIVTNLGAPQDTWIRLEASFLYDPRTTPHPDALGAQIGDDILAFLRTTSLPQIQGVAGLQNLRLDLNERAAIRSKGTVKELVIRSLVIQ
ncbi:MAG: flagellar basal body-associated FliL family protein [Roseiarcus sp.]|jgi:flagellar FliL protein